MLPLKKTHNQTKIVQAAELELRFLRSRCVGLCHTGVAWGGGASSPRPLLLALPELPRGFGPGAPGLKLRRPALRVAPIISALPREDQYIICIMLSHLAFYQYLMTGHGGYPWHVLLRPLLL